MASSNLSIGMTLLVLVLSACARPIAAPTITSGELTALTPLPDRPTATASPTQTLSPTSTPVSSGPQRVILVSIEGGRADWLADSDTMPTLAALSKSGVSGPILGINPASSAVIHNSLASGSLPAQTGVVGERVHRPEDAIYWYTSGFDLPMSKVIPIWQLISQQGLTSAALFWPGATPTLPEQMADYTIGYGERDAYSALHKLSFAPALTWEGVGESHSPLLEAQFQIGSRDEVLATVYVLATDTVDDESVGYNKFILSSGDRIIDENDGILEAAPGKWTYWAFDRAAGRGADFLITNPTIEAFTLFQSGVYRLVASPEALQQALVERFGYFAPAPDYYALEEGWISDRDYMDMVVRQSDWMMTVTLWVNETYRPDLLLTVQSPLDQAGHQFLLVDERQPGYSSEMVGRYAEHLEEAAIQVDRALARLEEAIHPQIEQGHTALFVIGSTGMAPIHTQVNLNIFLAEAGLLRLGNRGFVVVQRTQAIAFTSGGSAHIYINLVGRDPDGIVPESKYAEVQNRIVEALKSLTDPETGEPVFARVLTHQELSEIGLDGLYAGDVFAQAQPGYSLSDDRQAEAVFTPVTFYGQQGYPPNLPEMQGRFVATTPFGQPGSVLEQVHLIDFAPTIIALLGIDVPPNMDGQAIPALTDD